jgi:hypothetical protein
MEPNPSIAPNASSRVHAISGSRGAEASLALYEEAGAQWIEERIVSLRDYAARVLRARGCTCCGIPT